MKLKLSDVPNMHIDFKKPIRDRNRDNRVPISLTRKNSKNVFSGGVDIRMRR